MSRESILVVDDDLKFLEVIKVLLPHNGYVVRTVNTAESALESAREAFSHVAILDVSLLDKNGAELLSNLLELYPDMVVIMLTRNSSVPNAVQSLNRGAFTY